MSCKKQLTLGWVSNPSVFCNFVLILLIFGHLTLGCRDDGNEHVACMVQELPLMNIQAS